jgi:dolichol kinase/membrane-associated phospholipid phosphatase
MGVKVKIGILGSIILIIVSLQFDAEILKFIETHRFKLLNDFMLFITNTGLFILTSIISTYLIVKRKYKEFVLVAFAGILSLESAYLLKKVIQMPRPYLETELGTSPLLHATGYSLPSLHAAFSLSVIPLLHKITRRKELAWALSITFILIAFSRTYLGVHYLSDIVFGGLIGFLITLLVLHFEDKYQIYEKFIYHLESKLELRRQLAHLISGVFIILFLKLGLMTPEILLAILIVGGGLSLICRLHKIKFVYAILTFFDRPKDIVEFPGKGAFFLVLGSFLALILFERNIAYAAIAIMAVGDSISTIAGVYIGKFRSFTNPHKHLEGTVLAIIFSTIAAFTFVDFEKAFLASTGAMIFETLTIQKIDKYLDDNVLIPLIAGTIMTFM